jgi:hypothetical protein
MHHHIIARIKHAKSGMGMEPANHIQLGIIGLFVLLKLPPGIGRKCEVNRPMITALGWQGGFDFYEDSAVMLVGFAQQRPTQFCAQIADGVGFYLLCRLLLQNDADLWRHGSVPMQFACFGKGWRLAVW